MPLPCLLLFKCSLCICNNSHLDCCELGPVCEAYTVKFRRRNVKKLRICPPDVTAADRNGVNVGWTFSMISRSSLCPGFICSNRQISDIDRDLNYIFSRERCKAMDNFIFMSYLLSAIKWSINMHHLWAGLPPVSNLICHSPRDFQPFHVNFLWNKSQLNVHFYSGD